MNKLAVLAMSLLLFFGTMLWYLANNSLNEFITSQIVLQGEYYTGKKVTVDDAFFNIDSGKGQLKQLNLFDINKNSNKPIMTVKNIAVTLNNISTTSLLTQIDNIIIDEVTLYLTDEQASNLKVIEHFTQQQLVAIVPKKIPPKILPNGVVQKKREKVESKVSIANIKINHLLIQIADPTDPKNTRTISYEKIVLRPIGVEQGLVANQLGAELLTQVFSFALSISSL